MAPKIDIIRPHKSELVSHFVEAAACSCAKTDEPGSLYDGDDYTLTFEAYEVRGTITLEKT